MEAIAAEVLGLPEFDGDIFQEKVKEIQVWENRILAFIFYDGHIIERPWENADRRYGRRSKSCQQ